MFVKKLLKPFIKFLLLNININLIISCLFIKGYAENLVDLYLLAKTNDPIILQAKQNHLAFYENLNIAKAKLFPKIYLAGNKTYKKQKNQTTDTKFYNYDSNSYSVNIAQPVISVIDWLEYAKTNQQALASVKQYLNIEQELLLRVVKMYLNVLSAIDQLETSIANRKVLQKRLEQASNKFKLGVIPVTDIKEAQARLDIALAMELVNYNTLNSEQEKIAQMAGIKINKFAKIKSQIPLNRPEPDNIELWITKARKYNLKVQALRYDLAATREAIKASYATHFPTINLIGSISNNKMALPSSEKLYTKQLAINLEIPIFSGGAANAQTKASIFKNHATLQELVAADREAESTTKISYYTILTNIKYIKALEQRVKSSDLALKAIQAAFKVGTRTNLDLLNAESDFLNAKKEYIQSKYEYIFNSIKLKQVTGSLCFTDLEQINNLLEQ